MIAFSPLNLLVTIILSLIAVAGALPTAPRTPESTLILALEAPTLGPRTLLGRAYLRQNLALLNILSKAIMPREDQFTGRSDRFEALQRRRVARRSARGFTHTVHAQDLGDTTGNYFLSNHTIVASTVRFPAPPTQPQFTPSPVQPSLAVATPLAPHPTRVVGAKHHIQKKVAT
ncbi:hypothetical protein DXG03_002094 [Asterophora parasitica]|uniref:Uncharacterized protein n=1 Tax=Asterophora parasitica TaxID=117018 RepID=A0A9P7KBD9_9AGAR|nr:hypothetical protein DXG03_002094 [Asterophora parasitica]